MNEIDDLLVRFAAPVAVADDAERVALAHARTRLDEAITRGGVAMPRRRASVLGLALAGATALAIALAAILALRSHPAPRQRPASTPVQARALVARLAVLRRPATRADIEPVSGLTGSNWRVVQSMTRLARTVRTEHGSLRIYFVVEVYSGPGRPHSALVSGFAYGRGAAGFMMRAQDAAGLATPGSVLGRNSLASIVPDKVARVRWLFGPSRRRQGTLAVVPTIRANVAFASAAAPKVRGPLLSVTWYDAQGRVIGSYDAVAPRRRMLRAANRAIARSDRQPVAPSLLRILGVLRRPPTRRLPHDAAASLAQQGGYGINVAQARFVRAGGRGFWVVPGSRGICLVGPIPGALTECGGLTGRGSPGGGGFAGGSAGRDVRSLDGIAPDGDSTVTLVLADGTVKHVPVVDNVYSVTVKGRFKTLIVRDSSGQLRRTAL